MNNQWNLLLNSFYKIFAVVLLLSLLVGCGDEGSSCAGLVPADPDISKDAVASTFQLSGIFTVDGEALAGVTVTLSGADTTTTTDADGNYTFTGLANGSYTVVPSLDGYVFTPVSEVVTINGSSAATDFVASATAADPAIPADPATPATTTTYKISGIVGVHATQTYVQGSISGVTVTLSGDNTGTTTTDADGYYEFSVTNGSYYVTPSKTEYVFLFIDSLNPTKSSALVNVEGGDQPEIDFIGSSTVSSGATITVAVYHAAPYIGGPQDPFGGVTVTLKNGSGTVIDTATTAVTGSTSSCKFFNLPNGTYTVTPSIAGYTFTPATASVTVENNTALTAPHFSADH